MKMKNEQTKTTEKKKTKERKKSIEAILAALVGDNYNGSIDCPACLFKS